MNFVYCEYGADGNEGLDEGNFGVIFSDGVVRLPMPAVNSVHGRTFLCGIALCCLLLVACGDPPERALGTLEWDRIALPAPVAEKIVQVHVREGQRVVAGQPLLSLDTAETLATLRAAEAAVARQQAALIELRVGPRIEEIERAKASLSAAQAELVDRRADYQRLLALGKKNYVSQSDIDGARAATENASAQVRAAEEQLLELERGTRVEEIDQGKASLAEARAQAQAQRVLLGKLNVRAPRAGVVDSIPFKLGDQAPVGGALVVMLTGETPYARVYVPQPMRIDVSVGQRARIILDSHTRASAGHSKSSTDVQSAEFTGRVRMVRNEPSFTPYYALTGDDVARLSYIAEIQLAPGNGAVKLPAGLPLAVEFLAGTAEADGFPQQTTLPNQALSETEAELQPEQESQPAEEPYDGGK